MKKSFYRSIFLAFSLIMPGCGASDTSPDSHSGSSTLEPIIGRIGEVHSSTILVLEEITQDQLEEIDPGNLSTFNGAAYLLKVDHASQYRPGQKSESMDYWADP